MPKFFLMKNLITLSILLIAFSSCEKEPEDLLIGGWKDLQSDFSISFQEGGQYSWSTNYMADPNSGIGSYETDDDTLKIEEIPLWSDTLRVTIYLFTVSKNELELVNLDTQDVRTFEKIKIHRLF
jgi:hypothetical protein